MAGWRDGDGRTAGERAKERGANERAELIDTVRHRPASLIKPILGFLFVLVLALALLGVLR